GYTIQGMVGDTLLEAYLTNPALAKLSLEDLSLQYLNQLILPAPDPVWEGCRRAEAVLRLHLYLREQLQKAELTSLYREVELPLVQVLARMEKTGVYLDAAALEKMSEELGERLEELRREIYILAGEEFNINSPRQLGVILFEKLKLPVIKRTKTGYSTDAEVLEELAEHHEMIALILEHRQLVKLKSTYVDGMRHLINPRTGKVHTTFNQAITATGRLSSTEPNLQNIPIRLEYGRRMRKFFAPSEPGWLIMAADYSQIELRALAHISRDKALIQAFQEGRDIHTVTASQVFEVPEDQVTREMRYRAKAVNFGIVYGISDFGLARDLGISRTEAKKYITQYFATYRGVREYMVSIVQQARDQGYVTTLLGRRRYLPELFSSNRNVREFGERAAINTPIQGTAADIIKVAMLRVDREINQRQLQSRMLLQVHDELIFEVPPEEVTEMTGLVRRAMEEAVTLRIPLLVAIEVGPNWYDLTPCI
ncbi:MAG: DNA polymerase I, partial [Syntrophomonadaceae bacterium]|nr:DNA polymerase I [Syntrophomonadaceae bacterium]